MALGRTLLLTLFALLSIRSVADGAHRKTPSYYWSRSKQDSAHYSHRSSHIGPLPHINDVMTEWSTWNPWGRCSRSCGGGVRSRTRACATIYPRVMPGSGIRTTHNQCAGESVQYEVCGTKTCPPGQVSAVSFRAAQCRHYNNRRVFGRLVNNWVPYSHEGINPCSLVCEGEGEGIVYTFGKVTDGTHCHTYDGHGGLCVNGRCLRLSCDGRLGGIAEEDMCRVCGGHNETCTRHMGVFHSDLPSADQPVDAKTRAFHSETYGYFEVTQIPKGAMNVHVTDNSPNFLALKAENKYILNGNWLIDWPGLVDAGGTMFSYSRAEDDSETLSALGPTSQNMTLMVLLREHNPGIHYEYWMPNSKSDNITSVFFVPLTSSTPVMTTIATTMTTTIRPAVLANINRNLHRQKSHLSTKAKDNNDRKQPDKKIENEVYIHTEERRFQQREKEKELRESEEKIRKLKKNKNERQGKSRKNKMKKRRKKKKKKRRKYLDRPISCGPCAKTRNGKEKFCTSDFVSRIEIINSDIVDGSLRHEAIIHQSYKNTVPLLHKEFLWVDNACLCPRLRQGRTYIVMGSTEPERGHEVRLVLDENSYVRRYSPKTLARIMRIRLNEMKYCHPWRRDLRLVTVLRANNTSVHK